MYQTWSPYVPVAERRRQAEREAAKLRKAGQKLSPVSIEGRTIARTFWGKAWCDNLERYSDYSNRLPRGRTYVRNGSVMDLQVSAGKVTALVSGSSIYRVTIGVSAFPEQPWKAVCRDCAGGIDSLVELLGGRFSKGVMERICRPRTGLFPAPAEISLSCSCPDSAVMCKHVAAVLYGVGARLDEQPELLFRLRKVDERDLLAEAGQGLSLTGKGPGKRKVLEGGDLSELFGLEIAVDVPPRVAKPIERSVAKASGKPAAKTSGTPTAKTTGKPAAKTTSKPAAKVTGKPAAKTTGKPAAKATGKPAARTRMDAGTVVEPKPVKARQVKAKPVKVENPAMTYLTALAGSRGSEWKHVGTLISLMTPRGYLDAAKSIAEIADQARREGSADEVQETIAALRRIHTNKPAFLRQLDKALTCQA